MVVGRRQSSFCWLRGSDGSGALKAVWIVVIVCIASACDPDERASVSTSSKEDTEVRACADMEQKLTELRRERDTTRSERDRMRDKLAELKEASNQLEAFEPNLEATTLHVYPDKGPGPREISGHIKNNTDATVAVMHLRATFEPIALERDSVQRNVVYELREPLKSGEVQHAPYGQQIIDAFPGFDTNAWVDGELQLMVTALEGPDGEILWDRRNEDPAQLRKELKSARNALNGLDERIAKTQSKLSECRSR